MAEKGLTRYMPPILKHNNFFTVKEIDMLLELGHTPEEFF
jgi:hypothetical protein